MPTDEAVFNRTRSRADWQTLYNHVSHNQNDYVWTFPANSPARIETIRDVVGVPKVGGRFLAKPVRHTKVAYYPYQQRSLIGTEWLPYSYRIIPAPSITQAEVDRIVGWYPPIDIVSERDFAQKAYDTFGDQFPAAVDLGNFIYEWNEVTDLIPAIEKSITKTVSGAHLSWSFGAAPLLGDLEALMGIASTVLKRIEWLRAHNGRTSRLRTTRTINATPAIPPSYRLGNPIASLNWPDTAYFATLINRQVKLAATCRLHMDIDIPEDLEAITRGMIAALGLNNPMGTIWNSLPFSFVVDWVWKFGDVLDRHKYDTYIGAYDVVDFTSSVLESRTWVVEYIYKALAEENVDAGYAGWTYRYDAAEPLGYLLDQRYKRDVGWTQVDLPTLTFPPSAGQAVLAASLLRGLT